MNKERLSLLEDYIKAGISPLLVQDMPSDSFENAVIIDANIDASELNGHYEDREFLPPNWYRQLIEKSKTNIPVLVIENINAIQLEEQTKFIEILKYKKVSTFDLPKNCFVVVTCSRTNTNKICEEVYSLLAEI